MAASKSITEQIGDLLGQAGDKELKEIEARMTDLKRQLASLKMVRDLIKTRTVREPDHKAKPARVAKPEAANGQAASGSPLPERSGPPPSVAATRSGIMDSRRQDTAEYLHEHGATPQAKLADEMNIPSGSMTAVLDHPWFQKTTSGIALTAKARSELVF